MKTSLGSRIAAFLAAVSMTALTVETIANYALPPSGAELVAAACALG